MLNLQRLPRWGTKKRKEPVMWKMLLITAAVKSRGVRNTPQSGGKREEAKKRPSSGAQRKKRAQKGKKTRFPLTLVIRSKEGDGSQKNLSKKKE